MNIAKFLRTAFLQNPAVAVFFQFDKVTVQRWASAVYIRLLFNQKHNVRWFLLKRFEDLFRVLLHY